MSVRAATVEDVPAIVALGLRLHELSSYAQFPFDEKKVETLMRDAIGGAGVVFVAVRDGRVIGGIAGGVTEFWFGRDEFAFDYCFFVQPESRNGSTAVRLLSTFEAWARIKGARDVRLGITTGIDVEETAAFYEWAGYTRSGLLFVKGIENGTR